MREEGKVGLIEFASRVSHLRRRRFAVFVLSFLLRSTASFHLVRFFRRTVSLTLALQRGLPGALTGGS
jgi:hypothetical protein